MNTPLAMIVLCAGVLTLGACDKTPTTAPTAMAEKPVATESAAATVPVADPSMPTGASPVYAPADAASADPTPGRPDGTRDTAQESIPTPIPGQNNDHSAPLGPAQPASAP